VVPAKRSATALKKAATHTLADGSSVHSLRTLLAELATLARNTCRTPAALQYPTTFDIMTTPSATQRRALELVNQITV
jgi:hypothetical protein